MDCLETITSCSLRLQCVTRLLQLVIDFFPTVAKQAARQIALRVTPAYSVQSLQAQNRCEINCKDKLKEKLHRVILA